MGRTRPGMGKGMFSSREANWVWHELKRYVTCKKKEEKKDEPDRSFKLDEILLLKDINLQIMRGQFVVIIGEIGAGKSSLLASMIGEMLYVPDQIKKKYSDKQLNEPEIKQMEKELYSLEKIETEKDFPIQINTNVSFVE